MMPMYHYWGCLMNHSEMVALIQGGVITSGGKWADFGAGSGNFTRALHQLIGLDAELYAIDRNAQVLRQHQDTVHTIAADFTKPIELPPLDGFLIANALHFVRDQARVIGLLASYLKPDGNFIVVEYDVRMSRGYIPFPLPYSRFEGLAHELNFQFVELVGHRKSPSGGAGMYAARAVR